MVNYTKLVNPLILWKTKVVPACSMLLLTLATRACLAVGGLFNPLDHEQDHLDSTNISHLVPNPNNAANGLAVLNPLAPQWHLLTEPAAWLEASVQVDHLLQDGHEEDDDEDDER